jgi:hypothetical protein
MGKPIIWSGTNAKLINSGDLIDYLNNSLTDAPKINYTWNSHGLTSSNIGAPVYVVSANQLALASNQTAASAEVVGFVYAIIDSNTLRIAFNGQCLNVGSGALVGGGTVNSGQVYYLSSTPGQLNNADTTTIGLISKPVAVGINNSTYAFINYRGQVVGSTNALTQIPLANNTTTTVQSVTAYTGGSLSGYVTIVNSTSANSLTFYVNAPFAKYGAGGNYYISPSYVGDTPPSGFTMTVTSGGLIQITMPNVSGYSSASIVYGLNVPAVGTNFPLSIDGSAVVSGTVGASFLPLATATTQGVVPTYSTGTFTPALAFGGGSTGITYGSRYGTYTKIGTRCFFSLFIQLTSKGTSTGACTITGLPFTSNASNALSAFSIQTNGVSASNYFITAYIDVNQSFINVNLCSTTANAAAALNLTDVQWSGTGNIVVTGHYLTA